jgi:type I restriction enzyme, R subunit
MALDDAFKAPEHPLRVAIVCAMWLTGFDVPSLSTLYLDKPLKAHTLMQAIARANRVNEGKNNGLIVDYCGILKTPAQGPGDLCRHGNPKGRAARPTRHGPRRNCWRTWRRPSPLVRTFLDERKASLDDVIRRRDLSATPPSWAARRRPTRTTRRASASR